MRVKSWLKTTYCKDKELFSTEGDVFRALKAAMSEIRT